MSKAKNSVIAGDYSGKHLFISGFGKKKVYLKNGMTKIELNSETVKSYELQNQDSDKSIASNIGKGLLFGMAGVNSKKTKNMVKIVWSDGKKSLLEVDNEIYKTILTNCFK